MKLRFVQQFSWIFGFLGLVACAPTPLLTMQTPAEIDTSQIQTVAVGRFEVGRLHAVRRASEVASQCGLDAHVGREKGVAGGNPHAAPLRLRAVYQRLQRRRG
mgnify:CR=1 FL=1